MYRGRMNIFVYIWKRHLFKKRYWQPEEIENAKIEALKIAKELGIDK